MVKRALVHARLDNVYEAIRKAARGIAFFGTPHRGGNHANIGSILSNVVRGTLRNPKNSFMDALKANSVFTDDVSRDFRHQLEDYKILSVYETLPFKKLGLIVDPKSATLDLPGTREIQIATNADHSNVCKFATVDGDDYEQVINSLVCIAEYAVQGAAGQPTSSAPTTESSSGLPKVAELPNVQSLSIDPYTTVPSVQLISAIEAGDIAEMERLVSSNITVDSFTAEGDTPSSLAAARGAESFVRLLIEKGACVNTKDGDECSPLYLACLIGNLPTVKTLIDAKADVNTTQILTGSTALHIAVESEDT